MEEADKDWMTIRMVGGWMFLLVPAHLGSPGQMAVKRLLLLYDQTRNVTRVRWEITYVLICRWVSGYCVANYIAINLQL